MYQMNPRQYEGVCTDVSNEAVMYEMNPRTIVMFNEKNEEQPFALVK